MGPAPYSAAGWCPPALARSQRAQSLQLPSGAHTPLVRLESVVCARGAHRLGVESLGAPGSHTAPPRGPSQAVPRYVGALRSWRFPIQWSEGISGPPAVVVTRTGPVAPAAVGAWPASLEFRAPDSSSIRLELELKCPCDVCVTLPKGTRHCLTGFDLHERDFAPRPARCRASPFQQWRATAEK